MSITKDKKEKILDYMLEKIELQENVIQKTEECFKISRTSIYRYLKELENDNVITKKGRGIYTIVNEKYCFNFNNDDLSES